MLGFDRFLGVFNTAADHSRFDGNALFHAQALQKVRDPLLSENAHQVVFKGEIETRRAGIALPAGASAKLVINSAGLVAFGSKNMQAANRSDFVVFLIRLYLVAIEGFSPL